ncbi:MAG: hypothetical protein J5495_00555 [Bacteroidales bacterium]|nr:hypothetical protein [Bacteroidales bacterium]
MKKFFVILAAALLTFGAASTANAASRVSNNFAAIGLHTGYYTGEMGLGLNLDFNAGNWRGRLMVDGGGFVNNHSLWVAPAVDFHYVLPLVAGLSVYPIVGVNGLIYTGSSEPFNLGLDLGAGVEYMFTQRFGIFAEGKYQYMIINPYSRYNGCFGFVVAL